MLWLNKRVIRLFLLNNIIGNLFIRQKDIKCSNASKCLVVQFRYYCVYNRNKLSIRFPVMPHKCYLFAGFVRYVLLSLNAILFMQYISRNVSVRPHQVNHYVRILMPCLDTIYMVLFKNVHLHLIFYPIPSKV